ncbi:MAG: translocation/assembly module TamB domain-containing protein, partial [Deltaproteobacteria bacterium]|nr:translocation/assembly module TamB domain-containing protein [Deltaproteobacteria bacterium]
MSQAPKKRSWWKWLGLFFVLMLLGLVLLYEFIQSPRFLRFALNQLNKSIQGELAYDNLSIDLNRGHLSLTGLRYQNTTGQKVLGLNSLDLDFKFSSALSGNLAIERMRAQGLLIDQRNSKKGKSSWRTALRIVLKRVSAKDSVVRDIDFYLRNGDEFHFDSADVNLTTQVSTKQEVKLTVDHSVLKIAGKEIKAGKLDFGGKIVLPVLQDFSFFVSEAAGHLNLENVEIASQPPSSFNSDFKIGGDTLYLENGRFLHPEGTVLVDLDYIPSKSTYKVDLKSESPLPFSVIPHAGKELLETFDKFDFQLRAELEGYKLDQMTGKVALEVKAIGDTANKLCPENKLHLVGNMNKGVLDLKEFQLQSFKSTVNGKGKIDFPKQNLDVKVETKAFDLATLIQALSDLDLRGYADAEGTITGPFKSPDFNFKATGHELAYSFLNFGDNTGVFKITNGTLSYEGNAPASTGYTAGVQVRSDEIFKKTRHTVLKTQFQGIEAAKLLDNPDITGKVSGNFELNSVAPNTPTATLKADIQDFNLYSFKLGPIAAEGKLGNHKFSVSPLSFQPPNSEKITLPSETLFEFDENGVKVKGQALPGLTFTGHYAYKGIRKFFIDADAKNVDLRPIWAALGLPLVETYADGQIKLGLGIEKTPSEIVINASHFEIPLDEGKITNDGPLKITINPPKMTFNSARFRSGDGVLAVTGSYTFDGPMALKLDGKLDLEILTYWRAFFRDAEGFANVDLKLGGTLKNPDIQGEINFNDAMLVLRAVRGTIENLSGKIRHNGKSLTFENLSGTMSEGDITVNGRVDLDGLTPKFTDLNINTREVAVSEPEVYKIVFSGDFGLKGPADSMLLSGDMFITEGRYIRNFNISQFILKPQAKTLPSEPNPWLDRIRLALRIKSPGELAIKNNIALMYLATDLKVTGPASQPDIQGEIQILDGAFNYFKIAFENARGYIDFRGPKTQPYVDVTATKEVLRNLGSVNVTAQIVGYLDNLQLNFLSDSGLPKRDILAMVFTGGSPGAPGTSS